MTQENQAKRIITDAEIISAFKGTNFGSPELFDHKKIRHEGVKKTAAHWHNGWYDWPYWGGPMTTPYPITRFVTHYSGKVVATLDSEGKSRMRCRFHLADPASGMAGGGEGECQLTDGRVVQAVFANQ